MARKIIVLFVIGVLLMSMAAAVSADPATDGCYLDAPAAVNEGVIIPVVVKCDNIPISNEVFGFQLGTSVTTGSYAGSLPLVYVDGTFTDDAIGGVLEGSNELALYGVSRRLNNFVNTDNFTLGSYTLTAVTNRTATSGSVAIDFDDTTFKLSNSIGAALTGWLRTVNDSSTTVNDIDLAWLSGNTTVKSDSNAIGLIENVNLNLGAKQFNMPSEAAYQTVFNMDSAYLYVEDETGVVAPGGTFEAANASDNTLSIAVSADMWGHLDCSNTVNLGDAGSAEDVDGFVGTLGAVTLKAGDVNADHQISNGDFTIIAQEFGDSGADINVTGGLELDINLDDTVNVLDLVQVGRNFNTLTVTSCNA